VTSDARKNFEIFFARVTNLLDIVIATLYIHRRRARRKKTSELRGSGL
jgi:hypothetical protein